MYAQDKRGKQIPLTHSLLDKVGGTGSVYTEEYSGKGVAALRKDYLGLENKHNQLVLQFNDTVGGLFVDSSQINFTYDPDVPSITGTIINSSITNSHLAPMPAGTGFKGNTNLAFGGGPSDLTPTQAVGLLQNFEWSFTRVNTGIVRGPSGANLALRLQPGDNPSKGILIDNNTGATTINKTTNINSAQLQIMSDVDEVVRAETTDTTGNPTINLVRNNLIVGSLANINSDNTTRLESRNGSVVLRPGTSGTSASRVTAQNSAPYLVVNGDADETVRLVRSGSSNNLMSWHNADGRRLYLMWHQAENNIRLASEWGGIRFMTGLAGSAASRIEIDGTGLVAMGGTAGGGRLYVNQGSTTGIMPALRLGQADVSEEFIHFESTAGASNAVNTSALGAYLLKLRVRVNGATVGFIPVYA